MGKTDEAEADLLKARAIGDNYDIQTLLLNVYRRSGDREKHHAILAEARAKSSDALFLSPIVDDHLMRNDTEGALAFLRKAMDTFPKDGFPYLRAYGLLMDEGKTAEAQTLADSVVKENRTAPAVVSYFSGIRSLAEKKPEQALAEFKGACARGAQFHQPYVEAGLILKDGREFAEAARYLNAARLLAPGNPRLLFEWADCSAAAGNLPDALQGFSRAAAVEPGNPNIRLALMKASWILGDKKTAMEQRRWLEANAAQALKAARQNDPLVAEILK
jgi:tetratricopeptide (TPR) repeat protein